MSSRVGVRVRGTRERFALDAFRSTALKSTPMTTPEPNTTPTPPVGFRLGARHLLGGIAALVLLALPSVHIVRYGGAIEVVGKEHLSVGLTVVTLADIVRQANHPDVAPEGNLRHLVGVLEREGLIKRSETRLDDLARVGVVSREAARFVQSNQRPTYECAVRDWCR